MMDGRRLSNTVGTVLDPVFALRYRVRIPAGATVRIAFWTSIAASRESVLDLVDKHQEANAFVRAATLAWTQAQIQLRHLGIDAAEAGLFQRLAGYVLYADASMRPSSDSHTAEEPAGRPRSGLTAFPAICRSCCLRIDDVEDIAIARQLLRAHEYWRMKRLAVDLVILNERATSYLQDLQIALETQLRMSQSLPQPGADNTRGSVFLLRADLISEQTRARLSSVARVVLVAQRGNLADQLDRLRAPAVSGDAATEEQPTSRGGERPLPCRRISNSSTGLEDSQAGGREYVTLLGPGQATPAPWINVIANPAFGFQVAAEGGGFTWALNSRENQLTPWSNDPVTDRPGEVLYLRDEESGELWGPTAAPIRDHSAHYVARHGQGYSRFEHTSHGIELDLMVYVPMADPIKISRLKIRNTSQRARRLSVTAYVEWVLGPSRAATAPFIVTAIDPATGAMFAHNPWSALFGSRVAFADLAGSQTQWTADRREFLGRHGTLDRPGGAYRQSTPVQARGRGPRPLLRAANLRGTCGGSRRWRWSFSSVKPRARREAQALLGPLPVGRSRCGVPHGGSVLGRCARNGSSEDAGPLPGHHSQSLDALSDARLPYVGAIGPLSGERRLRIPRSASGWNGARSVQARPDARASAARSPPTVHRGRRPALVATVGRGGIDRRRRSHPHCRRSGLAGVRHRSLRRGDR